MLYEPAHFEPLTDEPWDPGHVEDAIATIVADAEAAFDPASLWPAHEWDGWEEPLPLKTLYVGAFCAKRSLVSAERPRTAQPRAQSDRVRRGTSSGWRRAA